MAKALSPIMTQIQARVDDAYIDAMRDATIALDNPDNISISDVYTEIMYLEENLI